MDHAKTEGGSGGPGGPGLHLGGGVPVRLLRSSRPRHVGEGLADAAANVGGAYIYMHIHIYIFFYFIYFYLFYGSC